LIDLRVEDHTEAVKEMERVLRVHRAYEHMNKGDLAIELGDEEMALKEYGAAQELFPENIEMKYWHAVSLVNIGKLDEALPMFKTVFEKEPNWIELTRRIVPNGLLKVDQKTLELILE
jgi:tetratricopeptide (TPR) repeat protein